MAHLQFQAHLVFFAQIPARLSEHGVDQKLASLGLVPLQGVGDLMALGALLFCVTRMRLFDIGAVAGALFFQLLDNILKLGRSLVEFSLVFADGFLQPAQLGNRALYVLESRDVGLLLAVILEPHIHGELVCSAQRHLGAAQVPLGAVCGLVALHAEEVQLVNQRAIHATFKHRTADELVEVGLRHTRQVLLLVNTLGDLLGKAAQARERTTRVQMQYRFGQATEVGQGLVLRAEEFEVLRFHKKNSIHVSLIAKSVPAFT